MAATLLPADVAGVCALLEPVKNVAHGIVSRAVLTTPGLRPEQLLELGLVARYAAGEDRDQRPESSVGRFRCGDESLEVARERGGGVRRAEFTVDTELDAIGAEIGRASCRERVYSSV